MNFKNTLVQRTGKSSEVEIVRSIYETGSPERMKKKKTALAIQMGISHEELV